MHHQASRNSLHKFLNFTFTSISLQEYLPAPPDSGGVEKNDETNGDGPSKTIAEAASKFEFTKVECLLFIFHTVGKQAPQFLTDNPEILKEFKVRVTLHQYC